MKQLVKLFEKDIESENFSRKECIVFGVLVPLALMAFCVGSVALINYITK
jgi:hypothetical protein